MSGITLLAANTNVQHAIELAFIRSEHFIRTYWIVTVGIPKQSNNNFRLGIKLISNPYFKNKKVNLLNNFLKINYIFNKFSANSYHIMV